MNLRQINPPSRISATARFPLQIGESLWSFKEKVQKIKIKLPQFDSKKINALKLATATVIPIALAITVMAAPRPVESAPTEVVTAMPLKLEKNVFQLEDVGKVQIVVGESASERGAREAQQKTVAKTVRIASVSRPQEEIKAYAFELICSRWDASQWEPFDFIVGRESGWDWQARNRSSGAYGLGQAFPASKMGDLANTPEGQVQWVVAYIADRYGSPSSAHQFWASHGWY